MSVAKSVEEFELAAKDLIWSSDDTLLQGAEVICIEPSKASLLSKRRCIIRTNRGRLFLADYNQICDTCSALNRTCSPKVISAQDASARNSNAPRSSTAAGGAANPMTNLRRAATICSLLYETIQRDKFDVSDALHHVRTAMAHLCEVEAELQKRLKT